MTCHFKRSNEIKVSITLYMYIFHCIKATSPSNQLHWIFSLCYLSKENLNFFPIDTPGAPNENIVQNHLNIALLNVF